MRIRSAVVGDIESVIDGVTFTIRPLTSALDAYCVDSARLSNEAIGLSGYRRNLVKFGVVGWVGLFTYDDIEVPFKAKEVEILGKVYSAIDEDLLNRFTAQQIAAIADRVAQASSGDSNLKNVPSADGQPSTSASQGTSATEDPATAAKEATTSADNP